MRCKFKRNKEKATGKNNNRMKRQSFNLKGSIRMLYIQSRKHKLFNRNTNLERKENSSNTRRKSRIKLEIFINFYKNDMYCIEIYKYQRYEIWKNSPSK